MFTFIFLSLTGDSTFFDLQISIGLNECCISPFDKSQRKVLYHQEMHLLTLPCHQQHQVLQGIWFLHLSEDPGES